MKCQTISLKYFFCCERRDLLGSHRNGNLFTCEDNMLFSHVKISRFRAEAHLVYFNGVYLSNRPHFLVFSQDPKWVITPVNP